MEIRDELFNFYLIRNRSPSQKYHIKEVVSLTKFEVLPLDCNRVEGFQKSVKLETWYGFVGSHLRI